MGHAGTDSIRVPQATSGPMPPYFPLHPPDQIAALRMRKPQAAARFERTLAQRKPPASDLRGRRHTHSSVAWRTRADLFLRLFCFVLIIFFQNSARDKQRVVITTFLLVVVVGEGCNGEQIKERGVKKAILSKRRAKREIRVRMFALWKTRWLPAVPMSVCSD